MNVPPRWSSNDENGNPFVFGQIKINNGYVFSQADNQDELGEKLDEMVTMILDHNLNANAGKTYTITGSNFFLN